MRQIWGQRQGDECKGGTFSLAAVVSLPPWIPFDSCALDFSDLSNRTHRAGSLLMFTAKQRYLRFREFNDPKSHVFHVEILGWAFNDHLPLVVQEKAGTWGTWSPRIMGAKQA